MNRLETSVDTKNRPMEVGTLPSYANYYTTGAGTALEFPDGVRFFQISSVSGDPVWLRVGFDNVAVSAPLGNVIDGTAPTFINGSLLVEKPSNSTHFAVYSSGSVHISFWS